MTNIVHLCLLVAMHNSFNLKLWSNRFWQTQERERESVSYSKQLRCSLMCTDWKQRSWIYFDNDLKS